MANPQASGVEVFVDLSNVTKDPLLGQSNSHAALSRWDRLRTVWVRDRGPARFTLVADASLPRALSRPDQMSLERMVAQGEALIVPDADTEVLRRAIASRGIALSNDRYVDHRRMAGLQGARLAGWVVRGPNIRLQDRTLDRLLSAVISARAHKQELKELGLSERSPELRFRWTCSNAACTADLVAVPRLVRGSAVCPDCGAYLDRGEPWQDPIWLKVLHGPTEVLRFVIEDGEYVFIGSGSDEDIISLAEDADEAERSTLAERHLELENQGGTLRVRDAGSARGSAVRLPAAGQRNVFAPPMALSARTFTTVGLGSKIVLGGTLFVVQISGGTGLD